MHRQACVGGGTGQHERPAGHVGAAGQVACPAVARERRAAVAIVRFDMRGAAGKALVLIAAQVDGSKIGRIRLARVADASAAALIPATTAAVSPGSQVLTDGWSGYATLQAKGYRHAVVRDSALVGANLLPRANRVAALLQRWLLGTHQGAVAAAHLDYYLDEFTFRFNRRTSGSRGMLFYRLVDQAVHAQPVLTRTLKGGARSGSGQQMRQLVSSA